MSGILTPSHGLGRNTESDRGRTEKAKSGFFLCLQCGTGAGLSGTGKKCSGYRPNKTGRWPDQEQWMPGIWACTGHASRLNRTFGMHFSDPGRMCRVRSRSLSGVRWPRQPSFPLQGWQFPLYCCYIPCWISQIAIVSPSSSISMEREQMPLVLYTVMIYYSIRIICGWS